MWAPPLPGRHNPSCHRQVCQGLSLQREPHQGKVPRELSRHEACSLTNRPGLQPCPLPHPASREGSVFKTFCLHFLFPSRLQSPPGLAQGIWKIYSSEQKAPTPARKRRHPLGRGGARGSERPTAQLPSCCQEEDASTVWHLPERAPACIPRARGKR